MSKSFAAALTLFVVAQLAYATWLAGYRAGYDEGAAKAWDDARAALTPREVVATGSDLARLEPTGPGVQ